MIVVSLGLPTIVVGVAPHSAAEEVAVFRGGTDQRMILGERRCRLWRHSNLLDRLFEQPLDGKRVFYRTGYARGWPRRRVTPGPSSVIGTAWLT
ncbi:hypothetical protein ABIF93_003568 [Bradyrhizobium japonicum]